MTSPIDGSSGAGGVPRRYTRREIVAAGAGAAGVLALGGYGVSRVWPSNGESEVDFVLRAQLETVEFGRRNAPTWTFGQGVPGPEIRITQGKLVRIRVENALPVDTTIHWHGIKLDNPMDGVPALTQPPIRPGGSFLYEFVAPDAGTYFFHPHVGTQLDRGLYGALIVEPRLETRAYDREATLILDDWLDGIAGTPQQTLDDLLESGMKMGGMSGMNGMSPMDMSGTAAPGPHVSVNGSEATWGSLPGLANLLSQRKVDAGDVRYPLYLVNGRPPEDPFTIQARRGERLRLRLINAASDTLFSLSVDGHPLTVIASDGHDVVPTRTDAVVLGMGERLDVLLDADHPGAHRIIASPLGKSGRAVALLRYLDASRSTAPAIGAPKTKPAKVVSYADLRATEPVAPLVDAREIRLPLGRDMSKPYAWTLGGQEFPHADTVRLSAGEPVRFVLRNSTMMPHPMHLHGYVFRPVDGGAHAPLKDTITVSPMQTMAVEFVADNPGGWMFHCHNVYHQMAGMMRVVEVRA